jgi:hypothetical protein
METGTPEGLLALKYSVFTKCFKIWGFHGGDYDYYRPLSFTLCGSYKRRRIGGTYRLSSFG